MFIVYLKFADKSRAPELMAGHNAWLQDGFERGLLLLSGSLQPNLGGCLFVCCEGRDTVEAFVAEDPFVTEGVVTAEIAEVAPKRTDERLAFLTA